MSLFESASLCVTPNGTKASKLYAIKPTDGSGDLSVTRATTATRVNSAGLIESVAVNVPRLDYTNSTCPSILVEPQRTNLVTWSEDINNTDWFTFSNGLGTSPIITENYTTSPSGSNNADRVQFSNVGGSGSTLNASLLGKFPLSLSSTGTATFYMKSLTSSNQNVLCYWGAGQGQVFVVTPTWQRFTLQNLSVSAAANLFFGTRGGSGSFLNGGDEVLDIAIWGVQLEQATYATSYIKTEATTVTRNADVISKTGISSLIGQTEGTMYAEIDWVNNNNDVVFDTISDGTTNNRIHFGYAQSSNSWYLYIESSGVGQVNISYSAPANGRYKIAVGYKANDFVFYVNGVLIASDTSGSVPSTSQLNLGGFITSGLQYSNRATVIWKTRLSNSELATLTTI